MSSGHNNSQFNQDPIAAMASGSVPAQTGPISSQSWILERFTGPRPFLLMDSGDRVVIVFSPATRPVGSMDISKPIVTQIVLVKLSGFKVSR